MLSGSTTPILRSSWGSEPPHSPGAPEVRGERAIAQPQAWASTPHGPAFRRPGGTEARLEVSAQLVSSSAFACDVVAYGNRQRGLCLQSEAVVEAGDSICVGRRHIQAPARILEATPADPADLVLETVQGGKEQVPLGTGCAAAAREVIVGRRALAALPQRVGAPKHGIDGRHLGGGRRCPARANVQ